MCAQKIESLALSKTSGVASRANGQLKLTLDQGEAKQYDDRSSVTYALANMIFDYYIVIEVFEEGWDALIVQKTNGEEHRLPGFPLFNQDGSLFSTLSLDLEAGYRPNAVQIWQSRNGVPEMLYEQTSFQGEGGLFRMRWLSKTKLEIEVITLAALYGSQLDPSDILYIFKGATGWESVINPQPQRSNLN